VRSAKELIRSNLYGIRYISTRVVRRSTTRNEKKLDTKKYQNYEELIQNYNVLNHNLIELPQITRQVFSKDNTPSFLLIESLFSHFSNTYFYKLRQLVLTLNYSFSEGHFVSSAILLRSILEMICHHWYFLIRQRELVNTIHKISPNLKSKKHRTQVLTAVTNKLYEIYKLLDRANTGSNFPWNSHLGLNIENTPKQLHVMEAVEDLEKKSKIPTSKYYSLLSEMTHPNYGSHTLVVQSKGNKQNTLMNSSLETQNI
jgi:hypothetical protein